MKVMVKLCKQMTNTFYLKHSRSFANIIIWAESFRAAPRAKNDKKSNREKFEVHVLYRYRWLFVFSALTAYTEGCLASARTAWSFALFIHRLVLRLWIGSKLNFVNWRKSFLPLITRRYVLLRPRVIDKCVDFLVQMLNDFEKMSYFRVVTFF